VADIEMSKKDFKELMEGIIDKLNKLNPLEQRQYDEELAKERRRDLLAVQLSKAEAEAQQARRSNCSHQRYPASAGRRAGELAPRGTPGAEWCTRGQAYQNSLVMIFCTRCHSDWWFQPTQEYYQVIVQEGIYGIAPPDDDHTICIGCYKIKSNCECAEIAREHVAAHPTVV
jgi:hypothetical protein